MARDFVTEPSMWDDEAFVSLFWSRVDARGDDECWPWLGAKSRGRGSLKYKGRCYVAPRIARVLTDCIWPEGSGSMACHSCDNPICVNPAHIWWGTNSDNLRDLVAKGLHHYTRRSHCKSGHPLSGANVLLSNGIRRCKECRRLRVIRWRQSKKMEA